MKKGKFYKEAFCPTCKGKLDSWAAKGDNGPKKGDLYLCCLCAEVLVFNASQVLEIAPASMIMRMPPSHFMEFQRDLMSIVESIENGSSPFKKNH